VLGLPAARVRVVATPNGGGFGGKSDPFNHEIVAAKMALKLGRPVKVTLTREEVFYCHRGRHPVAMRMKTGFRKDGSITAQHLETALDGGAYGSYGVASTYYTGALQTVTYQLPRYRFDGIRAFTNKPPCGPKRGHGTPQPRFGFEVQLASASRRWSPAAAGRSATASCRRGAASASPAARTCAARACRSTGTTCRSRE
jgi:CO/xanthine dehydrogenase Mo-binding subunit